MTQPEKNLIFTLAYYNSLEYAPTGFELWKLYFDLEKRAMGLSYEQVLSLAEDLAKEKIFFCKNGFWFLQGSDALAERRVKAEKISVAKIKKAKRWVRFLRHLPLVRGICMTGTLAMKNSTAKSDWDMWVILTKNRIWLGRLIFTLATHLVGKRRYGEKIQDRFCLNHFFAEDGLRLEEQSEFSANELVFAIALFGKNVQRQMLRENQDWLTRLKPNFIFEKEGKENEKSRQTWLQKIPELILEISGAAFILNGLAKKIMIRKIENNPKTYWEKADVRFDDRALVFLPRPQRDIVLRRTRAQLTKMGKGCIMEE